MRLLDCFNLQKLVYVLLETIVRDEPFMLAQVHKVYNFVEQQQIIVILLKLCMVLLLEYSQRFGFYAFILCEILIYVHSFVEAKKTCENIVAEAPLILSNSEISSLTIDSNNDDESCANSSAKELNGLCVICCNKPKCIVLLPCQHLCLCQYCVCTLKKEKSQLQCPLCQKKIKKTMQIFT